MVLFLALAMFKLIRIHYRGKRVWLVALAAFIQPCINTICETCGVDLTTASESAIVYAMIPIAVVLITALILKRSIKPVVAGGIALSFLGVIISIVFSEGFSLGGKAGGYLFLIGMVVTGAVFTIMSGHISDQFSPMERTFTMALMGGHLVQSS